MIFVWTAAAVALVAVSNASGASLHAQGHLVRPVRVIVPFSPSDGANLLARLLSQRLHEALGQPVTVADRVGAAGDVGANPKANSPAGGYMSMPSTMSMAVNATLYPRLPVGAQRGPSIIVTRIHADVVRSLRHPDVGAFMERENAEAVGSSTAEFTGFVDFERATRGVARPRRTSALGCTWRGTGRGGAPMRCPTGAGVLV